jgi:hypothetical protein
MKNYKSYWCKSVIKIGGEIQLKKIKIHIKYKRMGKRKNISQMII